MANCSSHIQGCCLWISGTLTLAIFNSWLLSKRPKNPLRKVPALQSDCYPVFMQIPTLPTGTLTHQTELNLLSEHLGSHRNLKTFKTCPCTTVSRGWNAISVCSASPHNPRPLHTQALQGALSFSLELLLPAGTPPPNRCFLQFCNKAEINLEITLLWAFSLGKMSLFCATEMAQSWITSQAQAQRLPGTQANMELGRFAINLQSARDA